MNALPKRTVKGLLMDIRNERNYEIQIACEEEILRMFDDKDAEIARLREALSEVYACNICEDCSFIASKALAKESVGEEDL